MSNLTAPLGSRPIQSLFTPSSAQDSAAAQLASASGKVPAQLPVVDPVSLSSNSVSLSQQALNGRLAQLGDKTVDVAQKLIGNFAQSLFGDAAEGATFNFDSISVSADTSLSAAVQHFSNSAGAVDSAALQFKESSSFVGHGQIVTSDGQSFEFQIEVKYEASITATSSQTHTARQAPAGQEPLTAPDTLALTGKELPAIKFPGSLADLFKLLGRQLEVSADSGKNDGNSGNLSLRLIRLVNSAALIAPRVRADNPEATPAERNRALASYNPPAPSSTVTSA
jgi:FlaG/FlaF family flagellin (archaellin)